MTTKAEWQELLDNSTGGWPNVNDVYGRKFTAANGNSLFLLAAGLRNGADFNSAGEICLTGRHRLPRATLVVRGACSLVRFFAWTTAAAAIIGYLCARCVLRINFFW